MSSYRQRSNHATPQGRPKAEGDITSSYDLRKSTDRKNNTLGRPVSMARKNLSYGQGGPVHIRIDDWSRWTELGVKFFGFPPNVTTKDVWSIFSQHGSVNTIELYHSDGKRSGNGRVWFKPPPKNAFWQTSLLLVQMADQDAPLKLELKLEPPRRSFYCPSPVNPKISYPEVMVLHADCLDFGILYDPRTMLGMYRARPTATTGIKFQQDMIDREIEVSFPVVVQDPKTGGPDRVENYCFMIPLAQSVTMRQLETGRRFILLVSLESPPKVYRKYDEEKTHQPDAPSWSRKDSLFRQTDITFDPRTLRRAPITLKKSKPIIDIGRWTTYRFVFDMTRNSQKTYSVICDALRDYNIEILPQEDFKLITDNEPAVWDYIDRPVPRRRKKASTALDDLKADDGPTLSFPVRYQLEVCISGGYLNEHNMTKAFVDKLMSLESTRAQDLLEYVANQKNRIFNPMDIFDVKIVKGSASRLKIPHYCTYVRSATITPSTIYYSTPTVETSNRVVRQYAEYADHFLRVRFADEKFQGRLNATPGESMNEIYTRVHRALINGIIIGDRHFEFLASGNSQFREHGAYFFAPVEHVKVADIRTWMGDFQDIQAVALHIARLGQCFSTTRAIHGARAKIVEDLKDHVLNVAENKQYNFTDGVGKISKFLAQVAATEVGLTMPSGDPPSVFQFRLGGCKGILTVWPDAKMREIHLRPSQYKFPSKYEGLEIIRWSQYSTANLNRQLIMVLSALQVPDTVFVEKLKSQLLNLAQAMGDETMALSLLQKEIDPNQMTLTLASMILDGFHRTREPFMISLLQLWRAWSIKYLKEKAKIAVHKGAILFGCVDETSTLQGHFNGLQKLKSHESESIRLKSLPEIFVQLSKGANEKPEVITGPMILARNPSLHPGDVRMVRGVDVPALRHLKDVVVLPQTGDRDISSMCSGGDLDGDDYVVIWDQDLLPREWNHEPMNYEKVKVQELGRPITTHDITSFFVTYMKNNSLPSIATAHLAFADWEKEGAKSDKCLELAALHSKAVDYVKTGEMVVIPQRLRPPKWPHYMEKDHLRAEKRYVSTKVLGKLYDQVERVDFVPEFDTPFDKRILEAYEVSNQMIADAEGVKELYDAAMHRIMAQQAIKTEFEVWSTFVLSHANQSNDFKFHEEMGNISTALKDRFRMLCYEKAGGKDFDKLAPFVAAMYQVTRDQMAYALNECQQVKFVGGKEERVRKKCTQTMPLMSFPWIFAEILGKIASGKFAERSSAATAAHNLIGQGHQKNTLMRKKYTGSGLAEEDVVQTAEGITHCGELLELFQDNQGKHDPTGSYTTKSDNSFTAGIPSTQNAKYDGPGKHDLASRSSSNTTSPDAATVLELKSQNMLFNSGSSPAVPQVAQDTYAGDIQVPDETERAQKGPELGNLIDLDPDSVQMNGSGYVGSDTVFHSSSVAPAYDDLLCLDAVDQGSGPRILSADQPSFDLDKAIYPVVGPEHESAGQQLPPRTTNNLIQIEGNDFDMGRDECEEVVHVDVEVKPSMLAELEKLIPTPSN